MLNQPLCNRFRLYRRKDDMVTVHHNDRPGSASVCGINQLIVIPRNFDQPFDRLGLRTDNRDNSISGRNIPESDIYQSNHRTITSLFKITLFNILDLFSQFFNLAFNGNNFPAHFGTVPLRTDCIHLAVHFLNQKIKLPADR